MTEQEAEQAADIEARELMEFAKHSPEAAVRLAAIKLMKFRAQGALDALDQAGVTMRATFAKVLG